MKFNTLFSSFHAQQQRRERLVVCCNTASCNCFFFFYTQYPEFQWKTNIVLLCTHGSRPKWQSVRAEFVIWRKNFGFYCVIVNWWNIYTWIFQALSFSSIWKYARHIDIRTYAWVWVCVVCEKCILEQKYTQHRIPFLLWLWFGGTESALYTQYHWHFRMPFVWGLCLCLCCVHKQTHVLLFCVPKYFPRDFGGANTLLTLIWRIHHRTTVRCSEGTIRTDAGMEIWMWCYAVVVRAAFFICAIVCSSNTPPQTVFVNGETGE